MSLGSVKAQNISLDACYGSNHSSEWPSTIYLHLFVSDPTQGGTVIPPGPTERSMARKRKAAK